MPPRSEPTLGQPSGAKHRPSRLPLLLLVISLAILLALAGRWWLAREASLPLTQPPTSPQTTQESRQANKCVLRGNVSYSDGPCPQGAAAMTVWLEDASTPIPMPRAVAVATPPAPAFGPRNTPASTPSFQPTVQSPQAQCQAIEDYIGWLDSLGRQPNSSYTMDWIRSERKRRATSSPGCVAEMQHTSFEACRFYG